jgi:HlyD family secretion protein
MSSTFTKTMLLTVAATIVMLLQGCTPSGDGKVLAQSDTTKKIVVSVTPVEERTFEERIIAQGNMLAKSTAMVAPEIGGVITDMFVEEGDPVKAGETPLFQIDKLTVTQAYEIALQDSKVAACARQDAEAQLVAAQAQHDKAKLDYDRFTRLREQQAITPDAMEQMEAGYTVAKAQLERASTGVTLRAEQEKQAAAALAIAKKHLDDSLVFSPIDGWISLRLKKQGEFIGAGNPVVKVTNTQILEVSAFLPGEYYPRVKTGETHMNVRVSGIDLGALPIFYKSPEIQDQLRTFEVKCLVESPPEGVVPGAIADIEAVMKTTTGPGVPSDVIQMRNGKQVVFLVENEVAKAVEIEKGLVVDGHTEVTNGAVPVGASVITLGSTLVNDGSPVEIQQQEEK